MSLSRNRGRMLRAGIAGLLMLSLLLLVGGFAAGLQAASKAAFSDDSEKQPSRRPNIVLVNLDDCDMDLVSAAQLEHYPHLKSLAANSIRFTNCHVTTPLCGPSRACLFRGQYAHNTGFRTNQANLDAGSGFTGGTQFFQQQGLAADQLPVWLQNSGYHTMLVGKYYQGKTDYLPVPGWNRFRAWVGNRYVDSYRVSPNPDGVLQRELVPGYRTDGEADDAMELLSDYQGNEPFFLYLAPVAPHVGVKSENPIPKKWASRWPQVELPDPAAVNEPDVSDKPTAYRDLMPLSKSAIAHIKSNQRRRLIAMLGIDEMIQRLQQKLLEIGQSENTIIMLTSDHGYLMGQHRLVGKSLPLDQVTRVPLWVSWPAKIQSADVRDANQLLAHIDITATIADLANATTPDFLDGRSFAKLLTDKTIVEPTAIRDTVLIENWESRRNSIVNQKLVYSSIRKFDSQYTEWATGECEFYDLDADPDQLENGFFKLSDSERSSLAAELRSARRQTSDQVGTVATISFPTINRKFIGPKIELEGYAESNQLVDEVSVSLRRTKDGTYWNGAQWTEELSMLPGNVANSQGVISRWWLQPNLMQGIESGESLTIEVLANEGDLPGSSDGKLQVVFDAEPPVVEVLRPANNYAFAAFSNFGGTISDAGGIADAELFVQNLETREYFDGVSWHADKISAPLHVNVKLGLWHGNYRLPKGRFEVCVAGKDAAGNWSELSKPHRCVVDPAIEQDYKLKTPIE